VFDVRDSRIRILNNDRDKATLLVRVPAILTAYARVPIRWMTKVSPAMINRPESIRELLAGYGAAMAVIVSSSAWFNQHACLGWDPQAA
jgi:hypothetical protein